MMLRAPDLVDLEEVAQWRVGLGHSLRTTDEIPAGSQRAFYESVILNRASPHRYYSVRDNGQHKALVSLEHISWPNGHAEIGLIVGPLYRGHGIGAEAVRLVLLRAFNDLRIETVWGETYMCSHAVAFWRKIVEQYHGSSVVWPRRKWWAGQLYDADLFTITREGCGL